jgi:hypothetical protein
MALLTECKTKECQNKLHSYSLRNKERGRLSKAWRDEVEEDLNAMGLKNRQGNDQRQSGMKEHCIGIRDPRWLLSAL